MHYWKSLRTQVAGTKLLQVFSASDSITLYVFVETFPAVLHKSLREPRVKTHSVEVFFFFLQELVCVCV